MSEINAGIVLVTEFTKNDSDVFASYINYIDREKAKRSMGNERFNIFSRYHDYMDNPEKLGELFTENDDSLTDMQKEEYKQAFMKAQENDSLMWQSVFSFDNKYLRKIGVLDEDNILNEKVLKNATRKAIRKMLEKEGMNEAIWTAAIHYNTDNIHVHIATVELYPTREKKEYIQYETYKEKGKIKYVYNKNEVTGKQEKIPLLDEDGNILKKIEYRGKFKQSSINFSKSEFAKELLKDINLNKDIDFLMKKVILEKAKTIDFQKENLLKDEFVKLYIKLPKDNLSMLKYGSNKMKNFREDIDYFTYTMIENFFKDEYEQFLSKVELANSLYNETYGGEKDKYKENKIKDIKQRAGNLVLKEIVKIAKDEKSIDNTPLAEDMFSLDYFEFNSPTYIEDEKSIELVNDFIDISSDKGYFNFKEVKEVYSSFDFHKEKRKVQNELFTLAKNGNVIAKFKLAEEFSRIPNDKYIKLSNILYKEVYRFLEKFIVNNDDKYVDYSLYMLGKMNLKGLSKESDPVKAYEYFTAIENKNKDSNPYIDYYLGKIYENEDNLKYSLYDSNKAFYHFNKSNTAFGWDRMYKMIDKHVLSDEELMKYTDDITSYQSSLFYKVYKELSKSLDKEVNEYSLYKLGKMCLDKRYKDTYNEKISLDYLKKGIEHFNSSICSTAYIENSLKLFREDAIPFDEEYITKAVDILEYRANSSFSSEYDKYLLAKLYCEKQYENHNPMKAISILKDLTSSYGIREFARQGYIHNSYLSEATEALRELSNISDNDYDKMLLSKLYLHESNALYDPMKAIKVLENCSNEYGIYKLANLYIKEDYKQNLSVELFESLREHEVLGGKANIQLGFLYLKGEVVPYDIDKAMEYFNAAKIKGETQAEGIIDSINLYKEKQKEYIKSKATNYSIRNSINDLKSNIKKAILYSENDTDQYIANLEYEKMEKEILNRNEINI